MVRARVPRVLTAVMLVVLVVTTPAALTGAQSPPSLPPLEAQPAAPLGDGAEQIDAPAEPLAQHLVGPPGILLSSALADAPELESGLRLGGFSGLVATDPDGRHFLTVTDRGPNDEIGSGKNKKLTFPSPTYSPSIVKLEVESGRVRVVERLPLKLPPGFNDPVTGSEYVSGLSNAPRDEPPWSKQGRERLGYDVYGLDVEGLSVDGRDGSFWLCEEYAPSILHVAADGTILLRLVPQGLDLHSPGISVRDILPAGFGRRKVNRGFEGLGLSPDGQTLIAAMQSPLANPNESAGERSRNIRLVSLDVSDANHPRLTGVYLYLAESAGRVGGDQDDVKVGDLAALSASRVLIAERDNSVGGRHKMVYLADLATATNLLGRDDGRKSIEQMSEADLRAAGIKPVVKHAVSDLASLGYSPEKLEGLAIVDEWTIAAVNDNDFGFSGFDSSGRPIPSNVETRLVLVRLDQPLR
jgi:hypothetical protein